MPNVDAIIQEGVAAIKAGRKDDAKRVLMRAIDLDERSEQAWLWLSACVDTPEEQQICLENVLSINPGNQKARKGIDAISKLRGQAPRPPAAPPNRTPAAPAGGNPFGDNPFAGTGFDSNPYAASSTPDPALGSGWEPFGAADPFGSAPAASDPFAGSSSVDWGKPDAPAAYGSGKDVPAPSAEEYDSWVSNLQLGGNSRSQSPSSSPAFSAPPAASNPFGDAGFDSNSFDSNSFDSGSFDNAGFDNPFGAPASGSAAPAPSFGDFGGGSSAFGDSPFGGAAFDDSPYGSATNPPADNTPFGNSAFDNSTFDSPAFDAGPFGKGSAPTGSVPAFDSSDFGDANFDNSSFDSGFGSGPFGTTAPSAPEPSSFSNAPMKSAALNRPASPAPDPFGGSSYSGSSSGFDDPVDNLFNNVPGTKTRNDPFGGARTDPFANTSLEQYTKPPDLEKDNLEDLFAPLDNKGKPEPRRATSTMAGFRNYFDDIPAEIQMKGKTSPRMALTVGVLALLNAVSLALLVLNVMKR